MRASEAVDCFLTAPHIHSPVQAGPTGSSSLGALKLGLGCYGQHNGVNNIAEHLKSLHTCPKWMDNAPKRMDNAVVVVVRILTVWYNITIGFATAFFARIEVCLAAVMGWWRQVKDIETPPTPQNP